MRILVINPNSTRSMTETIREASASVARAGTEIIALNPLGGPASIQGREDGEAALPGLLDLFEREVMRTGAYDAVVIACFDDTGLQMLKARAPVPVTGIGEAAFHAAMLVAGKFSVVTTLARSIPIIEENIALYGFADRCARVRASGVEVLALEREKDASETAIVAHARRAIAEDGCDAIVLGCAGMTQMAGRLSVALGVPVIDGVAAATALSEALVGAGITPVRPTTKSATAPTGSPPTPPATA